MDIAGAFTPVPGGVGPLTIVMLMANTIRAAYVRRRSRIHMQGIPYPSLYFLTTACTRTVPDTREVDIKAVKAVEAAWVEDFAAEDADKFAS